MSMDRIIREEARLIILQELMKEPNRTLNSGLLGKCLADWRIGRPREWVHAQLRYLEAAGAIVVTNADPFLIAELAYAGEEHLERRSVIDGVKRPPAAEI